MRRLYEDEEWTLRQIADHFGVSWQAVHARFVREGVPLRSKNQIKKRFDRETLVQLYVTKKLSIDEVGKILDASASHVHNELERYGIETRTKGATRRKYPKLYTLKVGENMDIKRPNSKHFYQNLHNKARKIGMKISIMSLDDETLRICRVS